MSSARLSCLPIALVAVSMAFGAPAVRAQSDENATSWREIAVDSIMNAVHAIEARIASVEASLALSAGSFTTQQLNTRELCVSDETGAQTCITKAQLDLLLAKMAQARTLEQAPAAQEGTAAVEAPAKIVEAPVAVEAPAPISSEAPAVTEPDPSDTDTNPATPANSPVEAIPGAERIGEGSGSKEDRLPRIEQVTSETTIVTSPDSNSIPAEAAQQDGMPRDQESAITGSVTTEPSENAVASSPQGESLPPATNSSNE